MNIPLTTMLCVVLSLVITLCSANGNSSSKPRDNKGPQQTSPHGSCGHSACFCAAGIPGIPGSPGPAGPVGAAGSPGNHGPQGPMGSRGNKGDEGARGKPGLQGPKGAQGPSGPAGPPGKKGQQGARGSLGPKGPQGLPGPAGPSGKKGDAGARGSQGPQGLKGPQGPSGPSGPPGKKGDTGARGSQGPPGLQGPPGSLVRNWKQCAFKKLSEGKDTGLIKECVFKKMSDKTALRVYWAGNLRIYNCYACCRRWYFTFNGAECSTPVAIDGVVYMLYGTGGKYRQDLHRPRHIEGVCEKLHKGTVRVGFWVGNCAGYGSADAYTGWNSVSRMYVKKYLPHRLKKSRF